MFSIFKKKTEEEKLYAKYMSLLEEARNLSRSNRRMSDAKLMEAEEVLKKMDLVRA
ncbi:Lacal_2735 family protein [uncultured Arcticibacterium sp.]|uniref:Lacal_2735 family protein n=1 Tax=uncultured Arcticibacterium sp. TaxID=2173042 RepID=UPI0030F519D8